MAEAAEEIIRENCKERDIEIIDMAVNVDHKTFKKSFIKNASQSVGQGWEVVERYISRQKGYEKTDTVPVVVIDEEKEKLRTHKTWYLTFYNKLFGGIHQK